MTSALDAPIFDRGDGPDDTAADDLFTAFGKAEAAFAEVAGALSRKADTDALTLAQLVDVAETIKRALQAPDVAGLLTALGLGNLSNVAPADLPVSDATRDALLQVRADVGAALAVEIARALGAEALLAPLASPPFTGNPTAPTRAVGDNTKALATTEFVTRATKAVIDGSTAVQRAGDVMAGVLTVGPSGVGTVGLVPGDTLRSGYVDFRTPDGTRSGYIGYSLAAKLEYASNTGYHSFIGSISTSDIGDLKTYIDKGVRTDVAQAFTGSQQSRAKLNIGAPYAGATYLTASRAFTAADSGRAMVVQANGVVMTLPTLASAGLMWNAKYTSWGASFTIVGQPGELIYYNGAPYSSFPVLPGEVVDVYTDTGLWVISLRSPIYDDAPSFNRAQNTSDAQKAQLLANAGLLIPQAQCRLVRNSATQLQLVGWNGNRLWINGAYRTITNVLSGSNGLSPNTFYYVFAYWTGSTVALAIGIASPTWDPLYGIRVADGQGSDAANRVFTYVGAILTDANGQFRDDDAFRGVASLFNPPRRTLSGVIAASGSTASTAGVALGSPLQFVLAEPTGCHFAASGNTSNDTAGKTCRTDITLDQVAAGYPSYGAGVSPAAPEFSGTIAAGAHAVNLFASVSGGTGQWNVALFGELG